MWAECEPESGDVERQPPLGPGLHPWLGRASRQLGVVVVGAAGDCPPGLPVGWLFPALVRELVYDGESGGQFVRLYGLLPYGTAGSATARRRWVSGWSHLRYQSRQVRTDRPLVHTFEQLREADRELERVRRQRQRASVGAHAARRDEHWEEVRRQLRASGGVARAGR